MGGVAPATDPHERLYRARPSFYTALEPFMKHACQSRGPFLHTLTACLLLALAAPHSFAQEAKQKPADKPGAQSSEKTDKSEKASEKAENPAQIELLETKVRFEANGDSRKEVHALVKIHSELGVRQFAQLNFDFNRSFESVEIPMVHITHASGGTSDILPSAVTDRPNPAVVNAPAYQDVRVKSVRILGLQPGDTLEYRVIRTVSHHPLAPDFWLDHTFDRTGVVSKEVFEIDLPSSLAPSPDDRRLDNKPIPQQDDAFRVLAPGKAEMLVSPDTPVTSERRVREGSGERTVFTWLPPFPRVTLTSEELPRPSQDVQLALSRTWAYISVNLYGRLMQKEPPSAEIMELTKRLTAGASTAVAKAEKIYDFVSQKITTVDLPLGATGFRVRPAAEILTSSYATPEDKFSLFGALAKAAGLQTQGLLVQNPPAWPVRQIPYPANFGHLLAWVVNTNTVLDPSSEVAPFGLVPANLRGKPALYLGPYVGYKDQPQLEWTPIPRDLPFPATQNVTVDATLGAEGKLSAKVHYSMRGDNELLLRVTFHHSPRERWKEVAQLLSLTDGFRGQVTSVNASDPYATKEPFTVEYELEQPKFVDWSKKTVRIPALLPQFGLPDPSAKPASRSATAPIELGTPLEVETRMTLHLPPGATASAPASTSVERDYATYSSQYSVNESTITASRRIKFILREIPGARAADYNAFLRAVQSDESQDFTIERPETSPPKTNSAAPNATAPPKPVPPKP